MPARNQWDIGSVERYRKLCCPDQYILISLFCLCPAELDQAAVCKLPRGRFIVFYDLRRLLGSQCGNGILQILDLDPIIRPTSANI